MGVESHARSGRGRTVTDSPPLSVQVSGREPAKSTSAIAAGVRTVPPILVAFDNAGLARPQYGLQAADMVYEYLSEYGISRFTLVYFNQPAALIGPVRSCRMINTYLIEELQGIQMCSGASDGTLHYLWGSPPGTLPPLRVMINDYDTGDHFYRVSFKPAPHNVFTEAGRALTLRTAFPVPGGPYTVDPPHSDGAAGAASPEAPSVPLHNVAYYYDATSQVYRPSDSGAPRVDGQNGGNQLAVKNVVLMHVPFHPAGWVEDVNGGAQSIWYDMNGSGPAEVYSDGRIVHATWHQGEQGAAYYGNTTQPVYFTDESGNLLRLNTGLTWIHVLGTGQTS